jgi:hypothetical protein
VSCKWCYVCPVDNSDTCILEPRLMFVIATVICWCYGDLCWLRLNGTSCRLIANGILLRIVCVGGTFIGNSVIIRLPELISVFLVRWRHFVLPSLQCRIPNNLYTSQDSSSPKYHEIKWHKSNPHYKLQAILG